jgi:hypothetical protein
MMQTPDGNSSRTQVIFLLFCGADSAALSQKAARLFGGVVNAGHKLFRDSKNAVLAKVDAHILEVYSMSDFPDQTSHIRNKVSCGESFDFETCSKNSRFIPFLYRYWR